MANVFGYYGTRSWSSVPIRNYGKNDPEEEGPYNKIKLGCSRGSNKLYMLTGQVKVSTSANALKKAVYGYYDDDIYEDPAYVRRRATLRDSLDAQMSDIKAQQEYFRGQRLINVNTTIDPSDPALQQKIAELPDSDLLKQAIQRFEMRMEQLNVSPAQKARMREQFYNNIFNMDAQQIRSIAQDESGRPMGEMKDLVGEANRGGDFDVDMPFMGMEPGEDQQAIQEKEIESEFQSGNIEQDTSQFFGFINVPIGYDIKQDEEKIIQSSIARKHYKLKYQFSFSEVADAIELAVSDFDIPKQSTPVNALAKLMRGNKKLGRYKKVIKSNLYPSQ